MSYIPYVTDFKRNTVKNMKLDSKLSLIKKVVSLKHSQGEEGATSCVV